MTYKLKFLPKALKEWKQIAPPIRTQFKKKLEERLLNPKVVSDKLTGYENVYKIKLRTAGYRLAYEVIDTEVVVYVLAVGKREKMRSIINSNNVNKILRKKAAGGLGKAVTF